MAVIKILDEHIANQIAAGEVVERPSSVVKELVENAIDAGSTRIDVTVEEGGLQLIRVKDNGSGIGDDDVENAFQRHATSKILTGKDLFAIRSLGFRGEALASIAAVAKVDVVTSTDGSGLGRRLVIEGGTIKTFEPAQSMQGTEFTVRELFYNTPARLKYMKTIQTELGHISDLIYRLALSYPSIAFTLKHNDNTLLQTIGNGDLLQVIAAVYGVHTAKSVMKVKAEHLDFELEGYIGKPEMTRSNRNAMSWFVNGRYVRSFPLNQAVLRAYHTLLPINRFPMVVLQARMHPTLVDVNVHPAKLEVRFSKEAELCEFIGSTLQELLLKQQLIPQAAAPKAKVRTFVEQTELQWASAATVDANNEQQLKPMGALVPSSGNKGASLPPESFVPEAQAVAAAAQEGAENAADVPTETKTAAVASRTELKPTVLTNSVMSVQQHAAASHSAVVPQDAVKQQSTFSKQSETAQHPAETGARASYVNESKPRYGEQEGRGFKDRVPPSVSGNMPKKSGEAWKEWMDSGERSEEATLPPFPALSLIGQLHGTYLIASNEEGLYLIDQHAAHERINYEYYYEQFGRPAQASQELLLPITLEFTPSEAERIRERMHLLEHIGMQMEPFGGQTFLVRSHPYWFPKGQETSIIQEMTDWVLGEKAPDIAKLREASAIMCSCKASIKANQRLSDAEAETLFARLATCRQPYTCPHGRPIVVRFTTYDLEKMFKRVM
ncbi:DNA mismatch repair endonuclease MutL [Paenibacillus sp. OSY-SE]|uniref:DNA mismatch repair endonuclease MutL n=1 Tax=Paenibacillus sp. OSY-SE TaxID=1196323 RepID=UPI0002E88959|nr:DNA mismatch repair endonuclease MutL [Paenibacillus sp. OSY-SE]